MIIIIIIKVAEVKGTLYMLKDFFPRMSEIIYMKKNEDNKTNNTKLIY
jgi:hypothetical protein